MLVMAKTFPQLPLDPVALYRKTHMLLRDHQTESCRCSITRMDGQQQQRGMRDFERAAIKNGLVLSRCQQALLARERPM